MDRVVYGVYHNGELIPGCTWCLRRTAIDIMKVEMECEVVKLQSTHPDSQFAIDVEEEDGTGTINEYYYDEENKTDNWNFDFSKYEVKRIVRSK